MKFGLTIPHIPIAWARARTNRAGGHFTPSKQREYMRILKNFMRQVPLAAPISVPVRLSIRCIFERAKSNKTTNHVQKPDASNLAKIVEDAANGILYVDDAQIVSLTATKEWGTPARTEIFLETVES